MHLVKRKIAKLMKVYRTDVKEEDIRKYKEEYHEQFLESMAVEDTGEGGDGAPQGEYSIHMVKGCVFQFNIFFLLFFSR